MASIYVGDQGIPILGQFSADGLLQYGFSSPSWKVGVSYPQYSVVNYGGILWISTINNNLNNMPDPEALSSGTGPWFPAFNALNVDGTLLMVATAWSDYTFNFAEVATYQGNAYISAIDGNDDCTPPAACWLQFTGATIANNVVSWTPPAYSPTTTYGAGSIVLYNGNTFISARYNNIGNAPPNGPMAQFLNLCLQEGPIFRGAWSSTITYSTNQIVSYNLSVWQALTGNINSAPVTGNTNWQLLGTQFQGSWSSTTAYTSGQTVSYQNAYSFNIYVCVVNNTNQEPDTSPDWQCLGEIITFWAPYGIKVVNNLGTCSVLQWDPTVNYSKFSLVTYNGSPWIATRGGNIGGSVPPGSGPWFPLTYSAIALNSGPVAIGTSLPAVGTHFFAQRGSNPPVAITTSGNLGVGTTTPGFKVDILDNNPGLTGFHVKNSNSGTGALNQVRVENDAGALAYEGISSSTFSGFAPINGGKAYWMSYSTDAVFGTQSSNNIIFTQNGAEIARFDASGRLGIGTTTPHSKLAVAGLPAYANNAAAITGGLAAGDFYRTGGNPDYVCVVH